jgi:hypothetical protein
MKQKYEYKFVRIGEGWLSAKSRAIGEYQQIIQDHAREGWRLIQVFAPGMGGYGAAKYLEIILEREMKDLNGYRDRDAPRRAPLPHHRTYGSVSGDSAGQNKHR